MIFSCFLVAYYYLKFFQKVWLSIATFCVISENKIESNRLMALYIWSSYFFSTVKGQRKAIVESAKLSCENR